MKLTVKICRTREEAQAYIVKQDNPVYYWIWPTAQGTFKVMRRK
jgi:hypothetical protein